MKPGIWGVVIKGENSSLLQPASKIDPIKPLTRNPRDSSALYSSPLHATYDFCMHTDKKSQGFYGKIKLKFMSILKTIS